MLYPSYLLTRTSRTRTPTQELEGLSSHLSWDQKDLSTIFSRVLKQQMIVQGRLGEKSKWKLFLFGNCSTLLWIINLLLSQSKGTMIIPNSAIKELSFLRWALVPVPIPANAVSIKYLASSHKWQPNRSVELYILERVCDSVVAYLNLLIWPFVAKLMTWPLWTQVELGCFSRRLFPLWPKMRFSLPHYLRGFQDCTWCIWEARAWHQTLWNSSFSSVSLLFCCLHLCLAFSSASDFWSTSVKCKL